jgi:hypothetical protein
MLQEIFAGSLIGHPDIGFTHLNDQEAVVCGEGVALPTRIRFDDLARIHRPRSEGADFAKAWQTGSADAHFRDEGVRRWRQQSRKRLPV